MLILHIKILKVISVSFNECFPIVSSTRKYSQAFSKPWFTVDLLKLLRKKNKLYKKYISNPTPLTHGAYKSCRNKYTRYIRSSKKKYFCEKFKKCSNDTKNTWKVINQLLHRDETHPDLPSIFYEGDNSFNNSFDIGQTLIDIFLLTLAMN